MPKVSAVSLSSFVLLFPFFSSTDHLLSLAHINRGHSSCCSLGRCPNSSIRRRESHLSFFPSSHFIQLEYCLIFLSPPAGTGRGAHFADRYSGIEACSWTSCGQQDDQDARGEDPSSGRTWFSLVDSSIPSFPHLPLLCPNHALHPSTESLYLLSSLLLDLSPCPAPVLCFKVEN